MIESFVDLTYRGLSLGRRIRLTQIRPSTGYLELPAPMPVGTQIAITTDDGTSFEAAVTWVHEQVAGSDRAPGMIVTPRLGAAPAAAWWTERVGLPEDEAPRPRTVTAGGRSRPVTVRPRSHTDPMLPPVGAIIDQLPTMAIDLDARVADAAGAEPSRSAAGTEETPVSPTEETPEATTEATTGETTEETTAASTTVMPVIPVIEIEADLPDTGAHARPETIPEIQIRRTGEHDVVDDGNRTTLMESIDPATLGIDISASGDVGGSAKPDADASATGGVDASARAGAGIGAIGDAGDMAEVTVPGVEIPTPGDGGPSGDATEPPSGKRKKRRWWR